MSSGKKTGRGSKKMTPKQKALVALMPEVESGRMTMKAAMLKAGYAESTANEQSVILGQIGNNAAMQKALRDNGFDESYLAQGILEGTKATEPGKKVTKDDTGALIIEDRPDHRARGIFFKLGAELLNVEPPKHQINTDVTIDDMIAAQEGSSPAA